MRQISILVLAILGLSGCTDVLKSSRINPQTIAVYPGGDGHTKTRDNDCPFTHAIGDSNRGAINLDCFKFPEFVPAKVDNGPVAYDLAAGIHHPTGSALTPDQTKAYRNRLGAILMKQADDVCTIEKGRMVRTESGGNFLFSLLTTGLSTTATIVTGERAKTVFSALATASNATQDNFNSSFYKNQLIQAIAKSMDTERERLAGMIKGNLSSAVDVYSVDAMIGEINRYHQACSFEHGLQLLLDAAVDANGARAMLHGLANDSALRLLRNQQAWLKSELATAEGPRKEELTAQLKEIEAKITAQVLATAAARVDDPAPKEGATTPAPETGPD